MQVTNDGATILKAVGVDNPAAKVLVGRHTLLKLTIFFFFSVNTLKTCWDSSLPFPLRGRQDSSYAGTLIRNGEGKMCKVQENWINMRDVNRRPNGRRFAVLWKKISLEPIKRTPLLFFSLLLQWCGCWQILRKVSLAQAMAGKTHMQKLCFYEKQAFEGVSLAIS